MWWKIHISLSHECDPSPSCVGLTLISSGGSGNTILPGQGKVPASLGVAHRGGAPGVGGGPCMLLGPHSYSASLPSLQHLTENACKVPSTGPGIQWALIIMAVDDVSHHYTAPNKCAFNSMCNIHFSHLDSLWICPEKGECCVWAGAGSGPCSRGSAGRRLLRVEPARGSSFVAHQRLLLPAPQGPTVVTQCLERPWALKPVLLRPFLSRRLLVGHLILESLISTLSLKVEIKEIYLTE